ncbi:AB hydrolase superfamily protein C4A8.06c [Psilocybe cubensis]|uniref:Alpha/beta hydrolase fold-3 domain-containing protein n=2 Tax=Psilocybe cubensis TaxID=181762 RepID=A0A8H7Y5U3_PSICU|nr:AB hydrolase superfamily protein C4A8.06c [Psilocybe cubensis]KAH9485586.1 AB hydrolase superfamily protein C4A8.06c [Psilocybe cubensis]
MFANSLTREVSLKVGPVILEVLVKHYFDRLKGDADSAGLEGNLKQDDVLYHEAFTIVKSFLNASSFHTIEELQAFSNTRTPSPPWTHMVRVLVPMSCCEDAAPYLITALGGEDVAQRLVGGVKWWQVRGVNGVDAQWLTARKDWQDAKRRHKKRQQQSKKNGPLNPSSPVGDVFPDSSSPTDGAFSSSTPEGEDQDKNEGTYEKNMDEMRCILYLHGGGYYFGSVDQERYSIQRFARKINGRVFAINYRLAPQYPFPCGLQDALAAYLYLIRPPAGSAHRAVDPGHIIISGDSAGGGLSLALLQVIRDTGLPAPAGGVLISPWCDLTHSFPSVHINTQTVRRIPFIEELTSSKIQQDIIPDSGLSFHKPSLLWPPPSEDLSNRVHASLRFRIRQAFKSDESARQTQESTFSEAQGDAPVTPVAPSKALFDPEKVILQTESGETIEVTQQLQFYARNSMLGHPLVSPVMAYLGGLPPLLFIAGDKEVLRDEIIYTAHKAAYPEKFPVQDRTRDLCPHLDGVEKRYKATSVHLQVYDDSPHILPVLFSFTTPAKFCFRGIASFSKFVTGLATVPSSSSSNSPTPTPPPISRRQSLFAGFKSTPRRHEKEQYVPALVVNGTAFADPPEDKGPAQPKGVKPVLQRSFSSHLSRAGSILRRQTSSPGMIVTSSETSARNQTLSRDVGSPTSRGSVTSSDVGGHRFQTSPAHSITPATEELFAGDMAVYQGIKDIHSWECRMIRERISTAGISRPLEPETELDAIQMPPERIGIFGEKTTTRFFKERALFEKKFAKVYKAVEKQRRRNLERAKTDTIKKLGILKQSIRRDGAAAVNGNKKVLRENVLASPGWGWAWALDGEYPPPSSIVSRRDTEEAQKLADIADKAVLSGDQTFSGNNLWAVVINFLTATPGRQTHTLYTKASVESSEGTSSEAGTSTSGENRAPRKQRSKLSLFHLWKRSSSGERQRELS